MLTALKWGLRAFIAAKALHITSNALQRTPQENLQVLTNTFTSTKDTIMSFTNSPGASLNPSRQAARNQARANSGGPVRTATTALLGSAGTDALRIGQWMIREGEDGNLHASTDEGRTVQLTDGGTPPTDTGTERATAPTANADTPAPAPWPLPTYRFTPPPPPPDHTTTGDTKS
jgi:hypothetical protein